MKALIVVDMQYDFLRGSLGSAEARAVIPFVKEEITKRLLQGYKLFFTKDTHGQDYLKTKEGTFLPVVHCISKSKGWEVAEELKEFLPLSKQVEKDNFGYLLWKEVLSENITQIELVGVCTDICVVSNALILRALYPQVEICVKANCCAGKTPLLHKEALSVMESCNIKII